MPGTGGDQAIDGAEQKGTYRVMVRERAELVRRVQAGEVSGVGLQHERSGWSVSGGPQGHSPNPGRQEFHT